MLLRNSPNLSSTSGISEGYVLFNVLTFLGKIENGVQMNLRLCHRILLIFLLVILQVYGCCCFYCSIPISM